MVGVGVCFCRSRCKVTDSIREVADITFVDYQQSPHCWFIPADSAALTPEPRPMENDLRHSLWGGGKAGGVFLVGNYAALCSLGLDFDNTKNERRRKR